MKNDKLKNEHLVDGKKTKKDEEKTLSKWTPFDLYFLTKQYFSKLGKNI